MKIGIMQPYLLAYIGYWQLINAVDKFVIYDDVNYINRGWINRNNILINGSSKLITLQLNKATQNKLINEIDILSEESKQKLLRVISEQYRKAPFYIEVYPMLEKVLLSPQKNLARYIAYSIEEISKYLGIDTEIIISSDIDKDNNLKGQDKIIEICKILEGTEYINAIGGQELYCDTEFQYNNLELKFIKSNDIKYRQFGEEFVPNLSIVDVLMFNSRGKIKQLLGEYELIK